MVEGSSEPGGLGAGPAATGTIVPSIATALPHFLPITIFPLVAIAAVQGRWWIVGPVIFLMFASSFETVFGTDEQNMDPRRVPESQLFWYKLAIWLWAALYPATFVFALWQMLVASHLSIWEIVLMAFVLAGAAQTVFIVSHELIHRRSVWERRIGELLLASAPYPQYATEHIYIHHALVCTPPDTGSAPKGQSLWQYFPRDLSKAFTSHP